MEMKTYKKTNEGKSGSDTGMNILISNFTRKKKELNKQSKCGGKSKTGKLLIKLRFS